MGKIIIKGVEFDVQCTVKNGKELSLHLLAKDEKFYSLAVYPDHYRLYKPLGDSSLAATREPLSNIVLAFEDGEQNGDILKLNVKG